MTLFLHYCRLSLVFLHLLAPRTNVESAQRFAFWKHMSVGQFYAGWRPYYFHLRLVANAAKRFMPAHYTKAQRTIILVAAYLHDIIEDARMTYNDVKTRFGYEVAEIVYAVSNEKGKNRKQRANRKYYEGIKAVEFATYIKLCDRYANISFAKKKGSSQYAMYKKEHVYFMMELSCIPDDCVELANAIELLLGEQPTWIKVSELVG